MPSYLLVAAAAAAVLAAVSLSGGAAAGQSNCQLEAQPPPFLYAGMVFGVGRVVCATPAKKVTLTVVLERNGVEVARVVRRDCQKTSVCWNATATVGDVPGSQMWCSHAWGSATGTSLGEARACEEGEF
jgi:hypothetical protein